MRIGIKIRDEQGRLNRSRGPHLLSANPLTESGIALITMEAVIRKLRADERTDGKAAGPTFIKAGSPS
jgi:hypothetical protein